MSVFSYYNTILVVCMRTNAPVNDTKVSKKGGEGSKFTIVSLKGFNGKAKLMFNHGFKLLENGKCIRFVLNISK